jgi:uncharacterized protein (TIGR03067 family)
MKSVSLCVTGAVALAHALLACGGPAPAANADLQRLQGRWQVTAVETSGRLRPTGRDDAVRFSLVIKGSAYTLIVTQVGTDFGPEEQRGRIRLDPSRRPKAVDFTPPLDGVGGAGIYALEGGRLRVCLPPVKGGRPRSFLTKGTDNQTTVLERVER